MRRLFRYFSAALILVLIFSLILPISALAAGTIIFSSSVTSGPVGTPVIIQGSGFTPGEVVSITNDGNPWTSATATGGTFSKSINIPTWPYGDHAILASAISGASNTLTFSVTPSITLSAYTGTTGTTISIYGSGFTASDSAIEVTFDSISVKSGIQSNTNGYFSSSFIVPSTSSGSHTVTASDSAGVQSTHSFTSTSNAIITLNKTTGTVGSSLTVSGTGFAPSESNVVVTYDSNLIGTSTTATSTGSWSITFNIPASTGGSHTIDASGDSTPSSAVTNKTITVTPNLTIAKTSGPPGTQVLITASGFADSEQGITVTWDSSPIGNQVNAGKIGAWTSTITIPASSSGPHNINASGPTTTAATNQVFTVGAGISLNKTSGTVGTSISVSGAGFGANDKNISITFEGVSDPVATVPKTTEGAWTANFTVPTSTSGDHTITATVGSTKVTAIFTTLPSVKLDTAIGSAGSIITASGSGFSPGQKNISIKFDDTEVIGDITASSTGAWITSFPIPNAASGNHVISIAGAEGLNLSIDNLTFKIKAAVSLSPETGTVGTAVVVKGAGFIAGSNINITYDDINLAKTTALSDGSFSKSVVIPASKAGDHEIKASDSANTAVMNFSIDGTAPAVPKPTNPEDGETVGFMSSITPSFFWTKVTASSPVTYTFQLDSDPEFSNPLEKTGLNGTKYSLSKAEALPRGDYYWRVNAIDAAGNESPWSQPQYLKSGMISPFLFILILILVIAGLGYGVFFLMTKLLPRRRAAQAAAASPEIVIPEIINAEFKQIDGGKSAMPWRLALPQAPQQPKGSKSLSSEDQARLKVIIDFAKSLPLPQPDSNTGWLVELAENVTGSSASPALYSQILKGEIQIRYEPAWMRHPTFLDLQALLEGQPIMQDLTTFVDSVNNLTSSTNLVLQDIYHDTTVEVTWDLLSNGGWAYISGVYTDGVGWFQGKNLREPSDRDYSVKTESPSGEQPAVTGLYGEPNTVFAGLLVKTPGEADVQQLRALHLKLRRTYRNSDKLKDLVSLITQLEVQRNRLLNAFSQFNRLST